MCLVYPYECTKPPQQAQATQKRREDAQASRTCRQRVYIYLSDNERGGLVNKKCSRRGAGAVARAAAPRGALGRLR